MKTIILSLMHYLFHHEDKDQIRELQFIVKTHQMMVYHKVNKNKVP